MTSMTTKNLTTLLNLSAIAGLAGLGGIALMPLPAKAQGTPRTACQNDARRLCGQYAEAYSDALAMGSLDPEHSDVFSKIRKDFDAAGVVQSDEQILRVMNELMLEAGSEMQVTRGGAPDAAALMLARTLKSR